MGEYFKKISFLVGEFFKGLTPLRRIALAGVALTVLFTLGALFFWAGNTAYSPLMSNLNSEDAANIMRVLRDKRIPFKVDPTGKNISIPQEWREELRLELATMGLPQSSVVGYEVFDKQSLGTTSFVQKINEKRAREGELMRTINAIKGVKRSRVHLALPQKSTFVEDQRKATASVVLDLEPGVVLGEKQIYGIGNLVARAVEGLDIPDVVIVDSNGKTLSKNASDPLAAATATQLDFQQKVETEYEKRIEAMLSRVVGEGRVVAKVSADLDFSQVNETQTLFDSDGLAVRSVEKRNDAMAGSRPGPQGVAGAQANQPGQPPGPNADVKYDTTRNNEVTSYEVPQTIRRTTRPSGGVKKLSVAVVVDGKHVKTVGKNGVSEASVEAWSAEKLKEFEQIVAGAVGIDRKRGDTLEIKNMEFTREDMNEAQTLVEEKERRAYVQSMVVYAVIGLAIALFFLFVVRPFIKWVTDNTIDSVDTFLPQTIEELEHMQKNATLPGLEEVIPVLPERMDPEKVEGDMIKEKIVTLVETNPQKAALILKDWLHFSEHKGKKPEKDDSSGGKGKSA